MFEDRDRLADTPERELALECLAAGIDASRPDRAVERHCSLDGETLHVREATYDLSAYDEVLILGGGKAADDLAAALVALLADRVSGGVVVTHEQTAEPDPVEVRLGEHPTPGEGSVAGAEAVLQRAREAGERTLVLAAITGGGSALLCAPAPGLEVDDLQAVTDGLLDAGAAIEEVNVVRRACSRIKGGGLAAAATPATVVGLLLSDVVGDDPAVIASGPTVPAPTDPDAALEVLDRYEIDVPAVRSWLADGADDEDAGDNDADAGGDDADAGGDDENAGDEPEEPPESSEPAEPAEPAGRVENHVVGSNRDAVDAAREVAAGRDLDTCVLSTRIVGESREAGRFHAAVAAEVLATGDPVEPPAVLLSGGETTVRVTGDGTGGPNLEFTLAAGLDLPDGAVVAAVDTDGRDGATDAAGAIQGPVAVGGVDEVGDGDGAGTAHDDVRAARDALARNDSYAYLDERGALLRTGATGTNVNDLRVLVV